MLSLLLAGHNVLAFFALLAAGAPARVHDGLGTVFGPSASDPSNSQGTLGCSYQLPPFRPRSVDAGEYAVALPGKRARQSCSEEASASTCSTVRRATVAWS